jgi:hypothetical protein
MFPPFFVCRLFQFHLLSTSKGLLGPSSSFSRLVGFPQRCLWIGVVVEGVGSILGVGPACACRFDLVSVGESMMFQKSIKLALKLGASGPVFCEVVQELENP